MPTYVFHDGRLIDKRTAPRAPSARSDLPCPMFISDQLGDVWNPVNGQIYDSKSAYYRAVKDAGCEIAGNDPAISRAPAPMDAAPGVEQDIKTAIEQLSAA
jgi:hypothetical protein